MLARLDLGGIALGVEHGRRLHGAGEDRRLAEREISCGVAEIGLRRRLDTGGAVAEEHAVEIELEDLVLGVIVLEPDGEQRLLNLAAEGLVGAEEEVLGELLGEGRGAAGDVVRLEAFDRDGAQAHQVNAEVVDRSACPRWR